MGESSTLAEERVIKAAAWRGKGGPHNKEGGFLVRKRKAS